MRQTRCNILNLFRTNSLKITVISCVNTHLHIVYLNLKKIQLVKIDWAAAFCFISYYIIHINYMCPVSEEI